MDGLLAQRLTDVLELPVDITVHLQHLAVVVRVGLEQRDLAVLRGQLLLPVKIVARDRHVLAARRLLLPCGEHGGDRHGRRDCRSDVSGFRSLVLVEAAQQIAESAVCQTQRGTADAEAQRSPRESLACVFHKKSSGKSSKLASSYSHSAASPVFMGDISGTSVYHLWDMLSS